MCVSLVSLSFFVSCVFLGSSFPMRPGEHLGLQAFGFVSRTCYGALQFKASPSFLSCLLHHPSKSNNKGPSKEAGGMVPKGLEIQHLQTRRR